MYLSILCLRGYLSLYTKAFALQPYKLKEIQTFAIQLSEYGCHASKMYHFCPFLIQINLLKINYYYYLLLSSNYLLSKNLLSIYFYNIQKQINLLT